MIGGGLGLRGVRTNGALRVERIGPGWTRLVMEADGGRGALGVDVRSDDLRRALDGGEAAPATLWLWRPPKPRGPA